MKNSKSKIYNVIRLLLTATILVITTSFGDRPVEENAVITENVKDFGAKGDGKSDDTQAIQKAIDKVASQGGGKVFVPDGVYMIRADRTDYLSDDGGIALQNNIHLFLSQGATLKAFPTSRDTYVILRVYNKRNVTIEGGTIEGERDEHLGTDGEWGYGVSINGGKDIVVKNLTAKDCWGDGINIKNLRGAKRGDPLEDYLPVNVIVDNVRCFNNYRQGMSIEGGVNIRVSNSHFSFTHGIAPACGIDVEPAQGFHYVIGLLIENCVFEENRQSGILIMGGCVHVVNVVNCSFINNKDEEAQFKTFNQSRDITVRACHFERNKETGSRTGILFQNAETLTATNNTLINNFIELRTVPTRNFIGITRNVTISKNNIKADTGMPYAFKSSGNILGLTIEGNTFDFNHSEAIGSEFFQLSGERIVFTNNTLLGLNHGIQVVNAPGASITNNAIHGSAVEAGYILNSPNTVFSNNIISGAAHSNPDAASFRILSGSDHSRFVNNQIYQTSKIPVSGKYKAYGAFAKDWTVIGAILEDNIFYRSDDNDNL